jgi:hypothetical protein
MTVEKLARWLFAKCLLTLNRAELEQVQRFFFAHCVKCGDKPCKNCEKMNI